MSTKRIYDLAADHHLIAKVQAATKATAGFGIVPEIALYGSPEWWQAIKDGRIPQQIISGVISDVFSSGDNEWPQFEIDSNGTKTVWTRFGDSAAYKVGRFVKLVYVLQKPKKSWTGDEYQKEVLSIDITM